MDQGELALNIDATLIHKDDSNMTPLITNHLGLTWQEKYNVERFL